MCPTWVKQSSITWHLLLLLPGLSQGAGTEAQAGTGTDLPAALCSHAETWRSCCFMLSPASAHRSSDVEYRNTFSKTLTCPCFLKKAGRRLNGVWRLPRAGKQVIQSGHGGMLYIVRLKFYFLLQFVKQNVIKSYRTKKCQTNTEKL